MLCLLVQFAYRPGEPDWSREMRGAPLISAVNHQNYLMVFTSRDADKAQDLFQTLTRVGPPMGMRFDEPQLAELPNDRTQTFLQGIEKQLTPETQMVSVCFLMGGGKGVCVLRLRLCQIS